MQCHAFGSSSVLGTDKMALCFQTAFLTRYVAHELIQVGFEVFFAAAISGALMMSELFRMFFLLSSHSTILCPFALV